MAEFNAADYLVTRHVREGRGDQTAVIGSKQLTYAQLDELVGAVAAAYGRLGLRRDDRVMFVMADDIPMLAGIIGAIAGGQVAVPVSTMYTGDELGEILSDSGARVLVCSAEFADAAAQAVRHAPQVEYLVCDGEVPELPGDVTSYGWTDFVDLGQGEADPRHGLSIDEDSWALWLYTSGTTGKPKAAMHRHANIRYVCETYGSQVLGITATDRALSIAKMFFAYGIGNSVFFPFSVGATTILDPRRPSPEVVADVAKRHRPTIFGGVPTFFAALLASDLADDTFASVRLATSAGEPLPEPLQKRFTDRFGVPILDGIGSTEALHIFLSNRPDDIHPGTTGRAVPGYELQIRDAEGNLLPPGTPGGLYVKGESIALGYWRRTEASRNVFVGEWLSTGDMYVEDEQGYFTCLGRGTDMLKAGGIWVSPAEVESRLLEHPAVQEAAVVGIADENDLQKPVAAVVAEGVTEKELIDWCRDGLAHFKAPRRITFVAELPKTATGKLQRFKVREVIAPDASATARRP